MPDTRVLAIVETAYRATLEEQDDPVIWLTHTLKGAGAGIDVLLRGAAVNYAVREQDASGLSFGARKQTHPPVLARDVASLVAKGARVLFVEEDAKSRGLKSDELTAGCKAISAKALPGLFEEYGQIWHW